MIEELVKEIGAQAYMECSALTQDGVKDLFEQSIRLVIGDTDADADADAGSDDNDADAGSDDNDGDDKKKKKKKKGGECILH